MIKIFKFAADAIEHSKNNNNVAGCVWSKKNAAYLEQHKSSRDYVGNFIFYSKKAETGWAILWRVHLYNQSTGLPEYINMNKSK